VPFHSITKIDAPGQGCDTSISVIGQSRKEAANAANCNPKRYRDREQVTGRDFDAEAHLG
jgi:hypothetical protein